MPSYERTDVSLTSANTPEITFVYDSLTAPKAAVRHDTKCGDIRTQEITCNVCPNPSFLDYVPSNGSTDTIRSFFGLVHVSGTAALESIRTQIFKDALYRGSQSSWWVLSPPRATYTGTTHHQPYFSTPVFALL